jgi:UDP-glucose 4-epimerase
MSSPKTALVTGGAGFIGSHLVDRLLSLDYRVAVVDDLSTGRLGNLDPAAVLYLADITHPSIRGVLQQERPSLVFHLAAQVSVSYSTRDPIRDAECNVLGALRLLEAARSCGVAKVIYSSTGGALYGEPETNPCPEEHPIAPLSPYGTSKYLFEQYLMLYRRLHGLNYTILRYGNVYGPRQDPHGEAGVVAIFAQAMLEGRETRIFGDGLQERDFVYVGDVVEANISAIDRGEGQAFNVGTGQGSTVNQVFDALKGLTRYRQAAQYHPVRPGDVYKISLECGKARRELGWSPQTELEEGLRHTVEYFRNRRH